MTFQSLDRDLRSMLFAKSESPRSTGVRCLLPSSPGLVKGDTILLDKCQELFCGTGMDMITVHICDH
jgi:hypothetical protein